MRENRSIDRPKRDKRLPETRVSSDELAAIKAKAAQSGLTMSEYQRQTLMNGVVIVRDSLADESLIRHLSAIGNNLNQLVRKSHIHEETDTEKMRDILEIIERLIMGVIDGPESQ